MKNKFYVSFSGGGRIAAQIAVIVVVAVLAVIPVFFGEQDLSGLIIVGVAVGVILIGSLIGFFATRLGDFILLEEDGISYRHLGKEKLFIPYAEAVAYTKRIKGMRGNRYGDAIVIGQRGSIPSEPTLSLFSTLSDGWFICVFHPRLLTELSARLGPIGENATETGATETDATEIDATETGATETGEEERRTPRDRKRTDVRRKSDDTHDSDEGESGGWRID